MAFAARQRTDPPPALSPLSGLVVRKEQNPAVIATLQGRTPAEMESRFAAGHRAYVAVLDGEPAAWGWVATRSGHIGETNTSFALPAGDRYLWNFVTRPSFRGMGVYPRLLDGIVLAESGEAECFWVGYAPENHASARGIWKAGFVTVAELSFDQAGRPAVRARIPGYGRRVARLLGLPEAVDPLAPCWRCVRAGRGERRACRSGRCACDYQRMEQPCAS